MIETNWVHYEKREPPFPSFGPVRPLPRGCCCSWFATKRGWVMDERNFNCPKHGNEALGVGASQPSGEVETA